MVSMERNILASSMRSFESNALTLKAVAENLSVKKSYKYYIVIILKPDAMLEFMPSQGGQALVDHGLVCD